VPRSPDARVIELEERLVELESRVAFQNDEIKLLDEVVREFALRTERLESMHERLRTELETALGATDVGPANERPPHY